MFSFLKKNDGYTLIIVLLVFTIMSTLGLSLLATTMNSNKLVSVNETTIKNKLSAENNMDEAIAYLQKEIDTRTITAANFLSELYDVIDDINHIDTDRFELTYKTLGDGTDGVYSLLITINAFDESKSKNLTKTIEVSTIAEVFKYAIATPGNLILNGAPYLQGDIFVGGDIQSRNKAKFTRNGLLGETKYWVDTSYPALNGNLTVRGKYRGGTSEANTLPEYDPVTNLTDYFSVVPTLTDRVVSVEEIKVEEKVITKRNEQESNWKMITSGPSSATTFNSTQTLNETKLFQDVKVTSGHITINGDLIIKPEKCTPGLLGLGCLAGDSGNGTLGVAEGAKLTVNGNIIVYSGAVLSGSVELPNNENYIYVHNGSKNGGALGFLANLLGAVLGLVSDILGSILFNEGNIFGSSFDEGIVKIYNLNLDGQMYVNGTVNIKDNLNTNGSIYAKEKITVENLSTDSDSDGESDGKNTLVLLAEDDILVANNNLYNDEPKEIGAYFYSNSKIELYGVGSNLKINGGISGDPIILNATKGKTKQTFFSGAITKGGLYFDNQDTLEPTTSRLSIIYNKSLMLHPPDGIPTIDEVTMKVLD